VELCKYLALYIHVFCCHCIIVYFNAVRSFDRKSEINHQYPQYRKQLSNALMRVLKNISHTLCILTPKTH